jgi:UDP-glucose 4-epimerase
MKVLVTGGMGFIGSYLVDYLVKNGDEVYVLDDFSGVDRRLRPSKDHKNFNLTTGSILDEQLVTNLMREVSICYHLAASLGVVKINKDPFSAFEVNFKGSEIVLKAAAHFGVRTLVASSSEIYGKNSMVPLSEDSDRLLGQTNINRWSYSEAKALDELYAFELNRNESFPVSIARFFNTVGPRQNGTYGMVLPRFIKSALNNDPIVVYGDGKQSRSFCSVKDVIEAIVLLMKSPDCIGQAYNIGSINEITIQDLALKVLKLTNSNSEIKHKSHQEIFGENFEEPHRRFPDISKINKAVGWKPKISLDEIIIDIADYVRTNEI